MTSKDPKYKAKLSYYLRNKEKVDAATKARREASRAWLKTYKASLHCERCGEDHPACLDFHHIDGDTKEGEISDMAVFGYSIERIEKEINKCIVLCSNCHRKEHYIA